MGVGAFLADMLDRQEYRPCLDAAEQLLMSDGNTLEDLLELNIAICRARLNLREYTLAVAPAMIASKLACDTKAYPMLGRVYYALAATMYYTNQFDNAIACCYEYFEVAPPAFRTLQDEGMIWHVMAATYGEKQSEYEKAVDAATRAVRCLEQAKDPVGTLRSGLVVVWNYIELRRLHLARKWLYKCMQQARMLPHYHWGRQMLLVRRAQLAQVEGSPIRASVLAQRALGHNHSGLEDLRFDALMLLHTICFDLKEYKDALGYALAARVEVLNARMYWREFQAAEAMMNTIRVAGGDVVAQLDRDYLATGVDMTRYVPESILKARD